MAVLFTSVACLLWLSSAVTLVCAEKTDRLLTYYVSKLFVHICYILETCQRQQNEVSG